MSSFTDADLLAFLDEMLPNERASVLEAQLRDSAELRQRLTLLARRRDQGAHTVGEIWRRQRLSCLSRSRLGEYLLGTCEQSLTDYIEFHLNTIGCRVCQANLADLRQSQTDAGETTRRRRKFFESSTGRLHNETSE